MPCDTRSTIRTVYTREGLRHILIAAERLGWRTIHARADGTEATFESPRGDITVSPGVTEAPSGAEAEAAKLMTEYAKCAFEEMVSSSPDLYEAVEETARTVTYNIKSRR